MGYTRPVVKNRWNAKAYDRIGITLPKGYKGKLTAHCEKEGISVNSYLTSLIYNDMGLPENKEEEDA